MTTDKGRDETLIVRKGIVQIKQFSDADDSRVKGDGALNIGPGKTTGPIYRGSIIKILYSTFLEPISIFIHFSLLFLKLSLVLFLFFLVALFLFSPHFSSSFHQCLSL